MIIQEFVRIKDKKLEKALEKLNKKRLACRGKEDYCDDGIQPDCKCDWGGDCEDLCRHSLK